MPIKDSALDSSVVVFHPDLVNLYGCEVGRGTRIGPFVEIQAGVRIGCDCKISSHTFICTGVTIEDRVFIGHGVMFCNDRYPSISWRGHLEHVYVEAGAAVGNGAVILPGVRIGANSIVGAGSVVTKDVPADAIVAGNPAKILRSV